MEDTSQKAKFFLVRAMGFHHLDEFHKKIGCQASCPQAAPFCRCSTQGFPAKPCLALRWASGKASARASCPSSPTLTKKNLRPPSALSRKTTPSLAASFLQLRFRFWRLTSASRPLRHQTRAQVDGHGRLRLLTLELRFAIALRKARLAIRTRGVRTQLGRAAWVLCTYHSYRWGRQIPTQNVAMQAA